MLLRRVMEYVNAQNWFAVCVDFVIVVVGVYIGIEVANWNDVRNNKIGLVASLERLDKEVSQNIDIIEKVLTTFEKGREDLDRSSDALNHCAFSPDAEAALERSLWNLTHDVQPNFTTIALDELAGQVRYQDLLSQQFQDDFGLYAGRLKEEHEQLTSHYDNMWSHHVSRHPYVSAFFSADTENYEDWGFKLDRPFTEICVDASFRNRFINTVGFYTVINTHLVQFKIEAEQFQDSLNKELEHARGKF